ncbi:hypothetical protein FKW77_006434 [Venturia effusa]|uniref:Uncharacterized protein n=1 Tax=Venturia effusa TaxID=50376 RepID=A0A517LLP0_9PEZI|nr:hypothetical protein FKW77_006434 [Venturia effusa]
MAFLPLIPSVDHIAEEEATSVATTPPLTGSALSEDANMGDLFGQNQYAYDGFQQDEIMSGFEGTEASPMANMPWKNLDFNQPNSFNPRIIDGDNSFVGYLNDLTTPQSFDPAPFQRSAMQQQWNGQQGGLAPAYLSQGNWQNRGFQNYEAVAPQLSQTEDGFDNWLSSGTFSETGAASQQGKFPPQYAAVNDRDYVGGHDRHDSRHNSRPQSFPQLEWQQQSDNRMWSGNQGHFFGPQFGGGDAVHPQQTMGMNQQFPATPQHPQSQYQQALVNKHRQVSPLVAPRAQRPLPAFIQNHTGSNVTGYNAPQGPEDWDRGQQRGRNEQVRPTKDPRGADGRQHQEVVPQGRRNRQQQATLASFHDHAPRTYEEGLQQAQQASGATGRHESADRQPSCEPAEKSQSPPAQVVIPPGCPIWNLTDYSLDFMGPAQKVVKKVPDEHWEDYPGQVQEFFTSPFPEYCLRPEDPEKFLPAVIRIKSLSPAQMLEYHARAPQYRDLIHQFIVPRLTGYPGEMPGDTGEDKKNKIRNNTLSMRQQRMREQHGQFMGDAKISRTPKGTQHKALTKVFMDVLPRTNGARLLHNTIGQIFKDPFNGWRTRTSFTGGGLSGDHIFPLRQPMAVPQPFADELKKAGLPEPDLHEHLRHNEEIWQLFYPQYYNDGKRLPPIEKYRRKTVYTKGRGRKAAEPGAAKGTKRQRIDESHVFGMPPKRQQTSKIIQTSAMQNFFSSFPSSRYQQIVGHSNAAPGFNLLPQAQQPDSNHSDGRKKRRTGTVSRNQGKEDSMMSPAAANPNRGSFMQQLNHQHRNAQPVARSQISSRQQQARVQQHEQVARIVGPGFESIVSAATSNERARQAQMKANVVTHDLRQEVPSNVLSQQNQPLVDDEDWADDSSSPPRPQGQSAGLDSSDAGEASSSLGHPEPFSSPIRYDMMALPRVPIGGSQWKIHNSAPPVLPSAVDLHTAEDNRHFRSSPPAEGPAELDFPQIPSSPLKSGLNDSGYFPGGLNQDHDDDSGSLAQNQDDEFSLDNFDLSQVNEFNLSYLQEDGSQMPETQTGQVFEAHSDGVGSASQNQGNEFKDVDLSQVSQFNASTPRDFANTANFQAQVPEIANSDVFGNGHEYDLRNSPPAESALTQEHQLQFDPSMNQSGNLQVQDQEDVGVASLQPSTHMSVIKDSNCIALSENPSQPSEPIDLTADQEPGDEVDEFEALMQAAIEDEDEEAESAVRKMPWSQLNDHASAHQAQWGDKVFDTCEACQQHREAMGMWGAEKTKKKVKGEAIGYGKMTEQGRIGLPDAMFRRG